MSPDLALLARTYVIGILVAAPVGAMGVLCIQRVLARGWRAGVATGLGIATADALYASVAAFGVAAVTSSLVAWQMPLRIVGGAVLVWLGLRAMVAPPTHDAAASRPASGLGAMYATAVGLTLTNPMTVMAFAAVFASAGLATSGTPGAALLATLGVLLGSLSWWIALSAAVSLLRHAISDRAVRVVNIGSGAVVAIFGLTAVAAGIGGYL